MKKVHIPTVFIDVYSDLRVLNLVQLCELLKIEDLVLLFPDFIIINNFKDEIYLTLEKYSY